MTIRVLHLIKGLGPGGAENLLLNQGRAAQLASAEHGAEPSTAAGAEHGTEHAAPGTEPGTADSIEYHAAFLVPWKNHLVEPLQALGWTTHSLNAEHPADLRWLPRLRKVIIDHRIDLVHGHSPMVAGWWRLLRSTLPKANRPASIYTEHNEWDRHRAPTRLINRATIGLEDHVIAVSDGVAASMNVGAQVLIHGIDVAAVAAQAEHRDQVRAELAIPADQIVVGIVANFRPEKAYDVLLDAAALVTRADPGVCYVSVGQGPLEAAMRARRDELGMGDRFRILGYRDDATRVMSGFDIFTLASYHEGLPVALMDAMALGLPVVATTVGGVATATEGWPAELVAAGDSQALAGAHRDMAERVRDGQASAPADFTNRFDATRATTTLTTIYLTKMRRQVRRT